MVKNYLLPSLFFLLQFFCFSQSSSIVFNVTNINLGVVREDVGVQKIDFYFVNTSKDSIRIEDVTSPCDCSVPHWSQKTFANADTGLVSVHFNPLNRPGVFEKQVQVIFNNNDTVDLTFRGEVLPILEKDIKLNYSEAVGCLRLPSKAINFGEAIVGEVKTKSLMVYNSCDFPVLFSDSSSILPNHIQISLDTNRVAPKDFLHINLSYDAQKANDWGYRTDLISISSNQKIFSELQFTTHATIVETFDIKRKTFAAIKFDTVFLDLPTLKQGDFYSHGFGFQNIGTDTLIVRKVQSSCSCIDYELEKSVYAPGEKGVLKLMYDTANRLGTQKKHVYVISNSPTSSVTDLVLSGKVIAK